MSGYHLIDAVGRRKQEEVLIFIEEEGLDVNYQDDVGIPSFLFFFNGFLEIGWIHSFYRSF